MNLSGAFMEIHSDALLANIVSAQIVVEFVLVQIADGQQNIVVEHHACLANFLDTTKVDDIGAVYSHEIVGKALFQPLERIERDYRATWQPVVILSVEMNLQIFAHSLDVDNVAQPYLDHTPLHLDEERIGAAAYLW